MNGDGSKMGPYCRGKRLRYLQWMTMKPIIYTRGQALPAILEQRIAILDGAMGTMIQRFKLTEAALPRRALQGPSQGPEEQRRAAQR